MKQKINVLIICAAIFLAACQPTPEEDIVVNKNEGVLESKINQEITEAQTFDVPETVKEDVCEGKQYSVVIDADVKITVMDAHPVYAIAPADFTQQEVDAVIGYFFGDKPLYAPNYTKTKSMIEDELVRIKADLLSMDPGDTDDIESAQTAIKKLEEAYDSAPETATNTQVTSELTVYPGVDFEALEACADMGYAEPSSISIKNRPVFQNLSITIDSERYFLASGSLDGKNAEGQSMTPEEAEQKAMEALEAIGIEGMAVVGVETSMTEDQERQGYVVTFKRSVNGVPIPYNEIITFAERIDMAAEWPSDRITIGLDDQGISVLNWSKKGEIQEELTANVEMLVFDEIMDIARQQLKDKFAALDLAETADYTKIKITSIDLEYACAQQKDNPDGYLLVPAWNFYISTTEAPDRKYLCALSLNAVDGSVIG